MDWVPKDYKQSMSKKPKSSAPEKDPESRVPESEPGESERAPEKDGKEHGKYYYDDAYGYEDYKPEVEPEEE